jgi:hypothetical protein
VADREQRAPNGNGVGRRLWAALIASFVALGLFSHLAYGASFVGAAVGILTTGAILALVVFISQASDSASAPPE